MLIGNEMSEQKTYTVSEANDLIHDKLQSSFFDITIEGEISGFRPSSSGHWYFTLKDREAAIDAAVFRYSQRGLSEPKNGELVVCRGSVSYYTKNGKLSFIVKEMTKKGAGKLREIIERRKEMYRSRGYFDEDRKRPIPEAIHRLGVVTSPTGAALRDILNVTRRRAPSLDIIIFPCAVQGDGAAESIASRIRQASLFQLCDVLIVGRGGGSEEDLMAFSDPLVIEEIHMCSIPVISAVGHEIDWPISDFVADKRAPTPSAAAEIVTEGIYRRRERLEKVTSALESIIGSRLASVHHRLDIAKSALPAMERKALRYSGRIPSTDDLRRLLILRMQNAEARLGFAEDDIDKALKSKAERAGRRITDVVDISRRTVIEKAEDRRKRADTLAADAERWMTEKVRRVGERLRLAMTASEALSPLAVLERGYAVVYGEDGRVLRGTCGVSAGDEMTIRMHDGRITAAVKEITK